MLKLSAALYQQIRRHGEETYPEECCGILLGTFEGRIRSVRRAVRCQNASAQERSRRFVIDPREVIRAQRAGRESDFDIVGFYHSHPDHPAEWSPTDLAEAHWIGCSYAIIAVANGNAGELKSFVLEGSVEENKRFVSEELCLTDA